MRRVRLAIAFVVIALLAGSAARFATRSPRARDPEVDFSCLGAPRAGWLTAQSDRLMVRIEWGADAGQVGVAVRNGDLQWKPRSEAEARALAAELVAPVNAANDVRDVSEHASIFVSCELGHQSWSGATERLPKYGECFERQSDTLTGRAQLAFECLRDTREVRQGPVDPRAAAVADAMERAALPWGLTLPAPTSSFRRSKRAPWGTPE
jgi:hypothetical protein